MPYQQLRIFEVRQGLDLPSACDFTFSNDFSDVPHCIGDSEWINGPVLSVGPGQSSPRVRCGGSSEDCCDCDEPSGVSSATSICLKQNPLYGSESCGTGSFGECSPIRFLTPFGPRSL